MDIVTCSIRYGVAVRIKGFDQALIIGVSKVPSDFAVGKVRRLSKSTNVRICLAISLYIM